MANLIEDILWVDLHDVDWKDFLRRYIILLVGLCIMAIGVNISIYSNIGTTPISSIPYVLSLYTPYTVGVITIIFNALLVVLQFFILRSEFPRSQVLQVFVAVFLGLFIDLTAPWLDFLTPTGYVSQWVLCVLGCAVLALGVYIEVSADAIVVPADGLTLAIRHVTDIEFGQVKVVFDSSNVIIAACISLLFSGTFDGVGLGTIFAMIAVGTFVRVYTRIVNRARKLILDH